MAMPKHLLSAVMAIAGALVISGAGLGQSAPTAAGFLKMVGSEKSNAISLPEIDAFATKKFGELKKPGQEALSMTDLRDRISQADFDAAKRTSTPRIRPAETRPPSRHSVRLNF
jgi:hypothetical protein